MAERWTRLSPSGTPPPSRRYPLLVFSQQAGSLFVFGGYSENATKFSTYFNDIHRYDIATDSACVTHTHTHTRTNTPTLLTSLTKTVGGRGIALGHAGLAARVGLGCDHP